MLMKVCLVGHDSIHEHRAVVEPSGELGRSFLVCHFLDTNELNIPIRIDSLLDTNTERSPPRGNFFLSSLFSLNFHHLKLRR